MQTFMILTWLIMAGTTTISEGSMTVPVAGGKNHGQCHALAKLTEFSIYDTVGSDETASFSHRCVTLRNVCKVNKNGPGNCVIKRG